MVGIMLAAKGLGRPLLEAAFNVLSGLSKATKITATFKLLPKDEGFWLDIQNGEFSKEELKELCHRMDIPFARTASYIHFVSFCFEQPTGMLQHLFQSSLLSWWLMIPLHVSRFKKRSFTELTQKVELGNFVMTMLLLRVENEDNKCFTRVLKRLVHLWCQAVENTLVEPEFELLLDDCPDPELKTKMHPYMQHSRKCGNRAVRQTLCKNFLARGGGYVTTRYELSLKKLGIVAEHSGLARLASSEFVARQLDLASKCLESYFEQCSQQSYGFKIINFTVDESRVAQQQVPSHHQLLTVCWIWPQMCIHQMFNFWIGHPGSTDSLEGWRQTVSSAYTNGSWNWSGYGRIWGLG